MNFSCQTTPIHESKPNGDTVLAAATARGWLFAVLDGAGPSPWDQRASQAAAASLARISARLGSLQDLPWSELDADVIAAGGGFGSSTCVICHLMDDTVEAVSVGDSEAWLLASPPVELSARQPLGRLGAANFEAPVSVCVRDVPAPVVVMSDGVHRYLSLGELCALVGNGALASELIEDLRSKRGGALSDDCSVILFGR